MLAALLGTGNDHDMSDTAQGPGWWLASDGKWYPPELWTGPPATGPAVTGPDPWSTPPGQAQLPAYGSGMSPGPAPYAGAPYGPQSQPGTYALYGQPMAYGGPARKTNGLAIASLICSCAGILVIPLIAGVVLGFVARAQIKQSHGTQRGDGLAIAGIIVGFGWAALILLGIIVNAASPSNSGVIDAVGLLGLTR
jgi:Domain of unknown function (DUF4190)